MLSSLRPSFALSSPLLSMAALSVEHLKVMAALTVEPAYASSSIYLLGGGAFGRAPKGDGGLISRACLRILSMAALSVEHLKVMAALTVEPAYASSDGGDGGLNSRARNPSPYE